MAYIPINIDEAVKRECERRRYSPRTIETYLSCIRKFLEYSGKGLDKIGKKEAREFLEHLSERKLAGSSLNVYHMAIRFLLEDILHKKMKLNIKYSRVPEKLPRVLTKEEVKKLLGKIENWKHKLMIELMYSAGLRVSEVINLKVGELELEKNYGFVRQGKGNKDRMFILANIVGEKMKNLIELERLAKDNFLFRTNKNEKYSDRSLQQIVKRASDLADLKGVHCHTLRHSFATHLIENGYSVADVQTLLGHKSPETTFVYLHTATPNMIKVKSPFESL